jgi:hypothetical protein
MIIAAILLLSGRESRGTNIAISGFNEDVVTEVGTSPFAHRFDGWGASLIEQGAKDKSGRIANVGLPPSRQFGSATGSGVTYFLQPYDAPNALRMGDGDPQTGTLTVMPGDYSTLHILVASGTGGGPATTQTSDLTLNFADGSLTLPGALAAYDWGTGPAAGIAIGGMARNVLGAAAGPAVSIQYASDYPSVDQPIAYKLYDDTLNLAALGFANHTLTSITFNNVTPNSPADLQGATDVMAIDGTSAVPEPSTMVLLVVALAASGAFWPQRHRCARPKRAEAPARNARIGREFSAS